MPCETQIETHGSYAYSHPSGRGFIPEPESNKQENKQNRTYSQSPASHKTEPTRNLFPSRTLLPDAIKR